MTGIETLTGVMRLMTDVFDALVSQPQVGSYLRSCVTTQRLTHAYLFSGPAGCGKQQAACSLAQALLYGLAPETESARAQSEMIVRKSHPDVHWLTPEGAAGYVVDQVRQIIADFSVAPFSAPRKVYVISQADKLGASCANALLKALEEPPATVTFILLAKSAESVLTTIRSRCQVVEFARVPEDVQARMLAADLDVSPEKARVALDVCNGSVERARAYLDSSEMGQIRQCAVSVMGKLVASDDLACLELAKELFESTKGPIQAIEKQLEEELAQDAEFLQKSAVKTIETRNKRSVGQAKLMLFGIATGAIRSWLHDAMLVSVGENTLVNEDVARDVVAASGAGVSRICRALERVDAADQAISYNVSPQLCFEALLFEIREVLYA